MTDSTRLIEAAFPLKQASLDSVHEKNVRHGHISTLHIWPARRPLAACRAALIATLLPDPGTPEARKEILEKLGGRVVEKVERKKMPSGKVVERVKEETIGGILHWGRETENRETLEWFRQEIRKAYGGRAPKVLDPFAGGGAIPLEAMRLGCEVTAIDLNPVAWFILKCTLEYPQKLAGQKRPLPSFVLKDRDFMEAFFKAQGFKGALLRTHLEKLGLGENPAPQLDGLKIEDATLEADLAWQVRAWGVWVLNQARRELAKFYPTYADFEPIQKTGKKWEKRGLKQVPIRDDGTLDLEALNAEFDEGYLKDKTNPRWIAKPTVAYLWARTVKCKNCRATLPLLKTRWLCKKERKRVLLDLLPASGQGARGVRFAVQTDVPVVGGNTAQRREHDRWIGAGTMTRSGATCPCCGGIMTMEDIRLEGRAGRLGAVMTAVVVDGPDGKEYRLPMPEEIRLAAEAEKELERVFAEVPFGLPEEPTPAGGGSGAGRAFSVQGYGLMRWRDLFTPRQLLALGTFVKHTRAAREAMHAESYPPEWGEAVGAYLALMISRLLSYSSAQCCWHVSGEKMQPTFLRFALPIVWDIAEVNPLSDLSGGYTSAFDWIYLAVEHFLSAERESSSAHTTMASAIDLKVVDDIDIVLTDPPYYDAIPYSDLMDFFYVWSRRTLYGLSPEIDRVFQGSLTPKWDCEKNDGELIDDSSRFGGDKVLSKATYEDGMFRAFQACHKALNPEGRFIVVFAHKHPDAWETLVSAIIRAGFVVDGSWPIQTEMGTRMRAHGSAALSSSVWLVCKKRSEVARPGWDNRVLEEMREKIDVRLREFWDAGIRGPDFVWAATGPAMEAYSKYPVVKKANAPGQLMTVSEFLRHVRRIVVDFVVGRVLSHNGEVETVIGLDDVTTYYLLHRHDFGMEDAPIGPCILYAVSCNLSDNALADQFDILIRTGGQAKAEEDEEESDTEDVDAEPEEGTGSTVKLKPWHQRRRPSMGYDPAVDSPRARRAATVLSLFPHEEKPVVRSRVVPLIDQVHRLMHLWNAGDAVRVDEYLDDKGLRRNSLFHQLLQALIELSPAGGEERALLESISNHVAAGGVAFDRKQEKLFEAESEAAPESEPGDR